jgi:hypothetical protein
LIDIYGGFNKEGKNGSKSLFIKYLHIL